MVFCFYHNLSSLFTIIQLVSTCGDSVVLLHNDMVVKTDLVTASL